MVLRTTHGTRVAPCAAAGPLLLRLSALATHAQSAERMAKAQAAQAARTAPGGTVGQRPATQAPGRPAPTAQQVAAARQQQAAAQAAAGQRPAPQRPQMPAPPSPQAKGTPTDFWNNFGTASDRDPQNAWKYLSAAQQNPEIFRQKLLVME